LHKKLAEALVQEDIWPAIDQCIRDNWQWIGVKEEDRPPGWITKPTPSESEDTGEEEEETKVQPAASRPPSLAEQRQQRQWQQEAELKKKGHDVT
jgi:hypothetical protein